MTEPHDIPPQAGKPKKERRSVLIRVRCKPSEIDIINSQALAATGGDVSEYVRGAALNQPPPVTHLYDVDRLELVRALGELGKIGSNVNQLAKATNQGQAPASAALVRAAQAVEQCADEIRFILTNYKPPVQ